MNWILLDVHVPTLPRIKIACFIKILCLPLLIKYKSIGSQQPRTVDLSFPTDVIHLKCLVVWHDQDEGYYEIKQTIPSTFSSQTLTAPLPTIYDILKNPSKSPELLNKDTTRYLLILQYNSVWCHFSYCHIPCSHLLSQTGNSHTSPNQLLTYQADLVLKKANNWLSNTVIRLQGVTDDSAFDCKWVTSITDSPWLVLTHTIHHDSHSNNTYTTDSHLLIPTHTDSLVYDSSPSTRSIKGGRFPWRTEVEFPAPPRAHINPRLSKLSASLKYHSHSYKW